MDSLQRYLEYPTMGEQAGAIIQVSAMGGLSNDKIQMLIDYHRVKPEILLRAAYSHLRNSPIFVFGSRREILQEFTTFCLRYQLWDLAVEANRDFPAPFWIQSNLPAKYAHQVITAKQFWNANPPLHHPWKCNPEFLRYGAQNSKMKEFHSRFESLLGSYWYDVTENPNSLKFIALVTIIKLMKPKPPRLDFDMNRVSAIRSTRKNQFYGVPELQAIAQRYGISEKGTKAELVARIRKL